jgi:glycosyltransferase involved in cell wall biosynthesis
MRIVIDLQGVQTESRFRGIGRYSLSLAKAIVRNRDKNEIIITLNGLFPETIESIRTTFYGQLPQENIRVWYTPGPVRKCEPGNEWRRKGAEYIREAFLVSLNPDIVYISSLFEGYLDDAVTSIGIFDKKIPVVTTVYDLIPFLKPDQYFSQCNAYREYYMQKIEHLKRANAYLCISECVAREARHVLCAPDEAVINISAASDSQFQNIIITNKIEQTLRQKFYLNRAFILYTGGSDERKNLHRLIRAYASLAKQLRNKYQLVLVGKMSRNDINDLRTTAKSKGLKNDELIFTGYVTDEYLVYLYNLCTLFVFPSLHEGFGLPPLEAMSCGAPVIGAKTCSVREIIGHNDALFDPFSEKDIASKIEKALTEERFRLILKQNSTDQAKKYSWEASAQRTLATLENIHKENTIQRVSRKKPSYRAKLAFISPLPPERSGIAYYSAELLPELSQHYDIEVVVAQPEVSDVWIKTSLPIRTVDWFKQNEARYERVIYQFGNSSFHEYMFDLLEKCPGVIVLHDFYLSSLYSYREIQSASDFRWTRELYFSHGYKAVWERFKESEIKKVVYKYPCNFSVLQQAIGIIVHSEYSKKLVREWYGENITNEWSVIPLLRTPTTDNVRRHRAKQKLGFHTDDFIVCSFGILDPVKQNHRLLNAWLCSKLSKNTHCKLIFVGKNHGGEYGTELVRTIKKNNAKDRVIITGWTNSTIFKHYLAATDIAVQLRKFSRGETSASILDCLNYGLPTIVNANGSQAELPKNAVYMLPDEFKDEQLIEALEKLWKGQNQRIMLGKRAKDVILTLHNPQECARKYADAIEGFYNSIQNQRKKVIENVLSIDDHPLGDAELQELGVCIAQNLPNKRPSRNIFIDISATCRNDLNTGIERVVKNIMLEMIKSFQAEYRIEPVYLYGSEDCWRYRYARRYTLDMLGCPSEWLEEDLIEAQPGDKLLIVDLSGNMIVEAEKAGVYQSLKNLGVEVYCMLYDILPITFPKYFPPNTCELYESWLKTVSRIADGIICISRTVADELNNWVQAVRPERQRSLKISWIHLGSDFESSTLSYGITNNSKNILSKISKRPSFLMVGTLEPRKGYMQVLSAFNQFWSEGTDINLVIVGNEGWKHLPNEMRRTIPSIVQTIKRHPQLGKRLFWLEGIGDEYLKTVYAASTCLLAASEGEGFGLPLIEAAKHNLPIISRNIPVFREVAGKHAFYFNGTESSDLVVCIQSWLKLYEQGIVPTSENMPRLTWKQSAQQLIMIILGR